MLGALTSLTGGGGLSASPSSSTGAQGGDYFGQEFGGLNYNSSPAWLNYVIVAAILVVVFLLIKGAM